VSSPDGTTWTDRSVAQNVSLLRVLYDSDLERWLAVSNGGYFASSANGTSWTATAWTAPTGGIVGLFRVEGRVYAVADDQYTYTENGTSWSTPASCPSGSLLSVHGYEDVTVMVFGGGQDLYARDDETGWGSAIAGWKRIAYPSGHELVRHAGGRWFAFGSTGEAHCSQAA
jgi:hypothetical protein